MKTTKNYREYMCAFGNCQERYTKIEYSANCRGDRQSFCCAEHAAAWLLRQNHWHDKDTPYTKVIDEICVLRSVTPS